MKPWGTDPSQEFNFLVHISFVTRGYIMLHRAKTKKTSQQKESQLNKKETELK
jgi:hypothetical protein